MFNLLNFISGLVDLSFWREKMADSSTVNSLSIFSIKMEQLPVVVTFLPIKEPLSNKGPALCPPWMGQSQDSRL